MLTELQIDRYSRQIILPEVGAHGQERLLSASIALVDIGGDVALLLLYLAAAGVGRLKIWSTTHSRSVDRWADDVRKLNDDCKIELFELDADPHTVTDADLVLLAESSPGLGRQISALCYDNRKRLIWSRARGGNGYLSVFDSAAGPGCYDCIAPDPAFLGKTDDASDTSAGALLASIQATEAIKSVLGIPSALVGSLLRVDASAGDVTRQPARPGCNTCGQRSSS